MSYITMIVITTEKVLDQTISFIPRESTVDTMYLTDESTNKTIEVIITTYTPGDYFDEIDAIFNCKEGHYYRLILKDAMGVEVYRDRIFCTDQLAKNYSPNLNGYLGNQTTNDFLMY